MLIADWVAIGVTAFFCLLGLLVGFGRGLRFFTGGFFGLIISIIVCYFLGGIIYNFTFVQELLGKLINAMTDKGTFCDILLSIRIDLIVYYVALFIVVTIIRCIIVKIVSSIVEVENVFLKVINRTLGIVFFVAVLVLFALIAFQIISFIGGTTSANFYSLISGSKLKLDFIYDNNPLMFIFSK